MSAPGPPAKTATRFGLLVTNGGKLAGLGGGINEAIGPARPAAIFFWVTLYLGAEALERLVTNFVRNAFGDLNDNRPPRNRR